MFGRDGVHAVFICGEDVTTRQYMLLEFIADLLMVALYYAGQVDKFYPNSFLKRLISSGPF